MSSQTIKLDEIDVFIFDFDGVLTDDRVYLDQAGKESVCCNRRDGLAFDVIRKLQKPAYILSTEKNAVVAARGKKLRIPVIQGVANKVEALRGLAKQEGFSLDKILYVGNDLNDYLAMGLCGYSVCPGDSHKVIKQISTVTLRTSGGDGVVRELLEEVMELDFINILYTTSGRQHENLYNCGNRDQS